MRVHTYIEIRKIHVILNVCGLCPGAPEGSTGRGSGLKRLRRRGHGLKSHPTDWWSPLSNSGTLGTRRVTYLLHHRILSQNWGPLYDLILLMYSTMGRTLIYSIYIVTI